MLTLAAGDAVSFWLPLQGSSNAAEVDWLFMFILWLNIFFLVANVAAMVYLVWKYRRRPGHKPEPSPSHNNALELGWSIPPTIIVAFVFYWGFTGFVSGRVIPKDAYEVKVIASQWKWEFVHPDGYKETLDAEDMWPDKNVPTFALHIPADRPVVFNITAEDVLHGFYVPAFRLKMDCIPGRYTKTWVKATPGNKVEKDVLEAKYGPDGKLVKGADGKPVLEKVRRMVTVPYTFHCHEYCGKAHSQMNGNVYALSAADFEEWKLNGRDDPAEAEDKKGKKLYGGRGCAGCHSVDGSPGVGPTWKGLFGKNRPLAASSDGKTAVVADENYIRESIYEPSAKIAAGYAGPPSQMPSYQGKLSDREIGYLIEYIKTLKE
jgi:cytochrome c oxidase subunit 2